jgi:hypothetical protein
MAVAPLFFEHRVRRGLAGTDSLAIRAGHLILCDIPATFTLWLRAAAIDSIHVGSPEKQSRGRT